MDSLILAIRGYDRALAEESPSRIGFELNHDEISALNRSDLDLITAQKHYLILHMGLDVFARNLELEVRAERARALWELTRPYKPQLAIAALPAWIRRETLREVQGSLHGINVAVDFGGRSPGFQPDIEVLDPTHHAHWEKSRVLKIHGWPMENKAQTFTIEDLPTIRSLAASLARPEAKRLLVLAHSQRINHLRQLLGLKIPAKTVDSAKG